jgi:uncharacterized coiled-coil protein SlyX
MSAHTRVALATDAAILRVAATELEELAASLLKTERSLERTRAHVASIITELEDVHQRNTTEAP